MASFEGKKQAVLVNFGTAINNFGKTPRLLPLFMASPDTSGSQTGSRSRYHVGYLTISVGVP